MFQPLPVRLDHALNADTVRLGDSRVGTLQEVELLAGKGRGAGRKLAAQPNTASPLSSPRRPSRASVRPPAIKGEVWEGEHQFPTGKVVAALHLLPEYLTQNLLWTFASIHPRPSHQQGAPPRYLHRVSSQAGSESRDVCGVYS